MPLDKVQDGDHAIICAAERLPFMGQKGPRAAPSVTDCYILPEGAAPSEPNNLIFIRIETVQ